MSGNGIGQAGSFESNDLMVTVDLSSKYNSGLDLSIESSVKDQFGAQIEKTVKAVLEEYGVTDGKIELVDKGALDFTIRARVKTALSRAGVEANNQSSEGGSNLE